MDRNEFATNTNSNITDYIKFADVKASIFLTVSGLLAGGVGRLSLSLLDALKSRDSLWLCLVAIAIAAFGVAILGTLLMSLKALNPDIQKTQDSLYSFPDIASMSCKDYIKSSEKLDENEIASHFYIHNWTLSCIANNKFKALQCAVCWLRYAVIVALVLGVLFILLSLTAKE